MCVQCLYACLLKILDWHSVFLIVCSFCIGTTASVPQHLYYNINVVDVVNGVIHAISVSVMSWCACIARLCTPPRKT